jgi:hypothetical protein
MAAPMHLATTGPRLCGSRQALRSCPGLRIHRARRACQAHRRTARKLASRFFHPAPPTRTRPEPTQSLNTHQGGPAYWYGIAPGCVVAPNSGDAGGLFGSGSRTITANSSGLSITRTLSASDPNTFRTAALYNFGVPAGANGVLVQMVGNSNSLLDSAGNPANPLSPMETRPYWEAWNVSGGAVVEVGSQQTGPSTYVSYNDMFNIPGWSNAASGTFVKTGTLVFFPNASMSDFPGLVPGGVPAAGRLNSGYTQPGNWSVDSNAQTHRITISPGGSPAVRF